MDGQTQPLVSVLTPMYNSEKYLVECIESVLAQTYTHWEYVIIDNCSADHSLEIAQRYAQQDSRIRIHQNSEFVGVIQNHNIAFSQIAAESKYCKMVHGDDWLFPDCITQMVQLAEAHPSVGIVSAYRLEEDRVTLDGLPYPSTVVPGRDICRLTLLNLFGGVYVFGSPTSIMIRSDLIRSRTKFYNEANNDADLEACLDVLQTSDLGFVHQVLTFTRRHNESNTSFARRFSTHIPGGLTILKNYGPTYLSKEEYTASWKRFMGIYYGFLGQSVWQGREKAFWDYHRQALMRLGNPLNPFKLAKAAGFAAIDRGFNPGRASAHVAKQLLQRAVALYQFRMKEH